jgi:hypothetical protein
MASAENIPGDTIRSMAETSISLTMKYAVRLDVSPASSHEKTRPG